MKKSVIFSCALIISLFLSGCANILSGGESENPLEYGTVKFVQSRGNFNVLDVEDIKFAKVSICGDGIQDEISVTVPVEGGIGSFEINKVPVGINRIISVQGIDGFGSFVNNALLKEVIDVKGGENYIEPVTRETSPLGYAFSYLLESGVKISSITGQTFRLLKEKIPTLDDCSDNLDRIDFELFAEDFKNSIWREKTVSDYILPETPYLKRIFINQTESSTRENPEFLAQALYSNGERKDITQDASWVISDENVASISSGKVTLLANGSVRLYASYEEDGVKRISSGANLEVLYQPAKNNYIYIDVSDNSESGVNYAKDNAVVAAWIWGSSLSSSWYAFSECDDHKYLRLELPFGAEKMVIARGKSLQYESSWSGLYYCWNQSSDLDLREIGEKNTFKPDTWNNPSGSWLYVDHGDVNVDYYYANVSLEPTEDDTNLSSVTVNGSVLNLAKKMIYTVPYETERAEIGAKAVNESAVVQINPSSIQNIENGGDVQFEIVVTAKTGNSESYIVKVKRSSVEPINSEKNVKRCFIDDAEEETVTIVYDLKTWGTSREEISKLTLRGSFTTVYNPQTKRWVEDEENFTLSYDASYNWYSIALPYSKISRPGFSGQPEFKFYLNGTPLSAPSFVPEEYVFNNANKKQMIIFDKEFDARSVELNQNEITASTIKTLSDFDLNDEESLKTVSNFRLVPGTTSLFRTYHPYYPTHEQTPTEKVRLDNVQAFMNQEGIKSDITLCNNRSNADGMVYKVDGVSYTVSIPDFYKEIIDNDSVLYVGDSDYGGNGTIPSANFVYYYSDSDFMKQWIKQIFDFICDDKNKAPFALHCEIGVDRTGVFSGIFAALCGASWSEISEDYEKSNLMGIGEFRDKRLLKYSFENMLKIQNVEECSNLSQLMKNFVLSCEISQAEFEKAVSKLGGTL